MDDLTKHLEHAHINIEVVGGSTSGTEAIPARRLHGDVWQLIRSPLYATEVASGDVIQILDRESGRFEILRRGGNVSVHFYLPEAAANDLSATERIEAEISRDVKGLGGRMDGYTAGLIVYSIPVSAGFESIEKAFEEAARQHTGSQWQYCNVYDPHTGEPLGWWERPK